MTVRRFFQISDTRRSPVILFVVALLVQLGATFFVWRWGQSGVLGNSDAVTYWAMAEQVRDHAMFTLRLEWGPMAFRTPLYPLFLAVFSLGTKSLVLPIIIQNVFSAITVVLVYRLGRSVFSESAGRIAALLFLLEPERLYLATQAMSETLFVLLLVSGLLVWVRLFRPPARWPDALVAGLLFGLATLTRPIGMVIPFLAAGVLLLVGIHRHAVISSLKKASIIVIVAFVVMSPWLVRNYVRFGAFRLSPLMGSNLYFVNAFHLLEKRATLQGEPGQVIQELVDRAIADLHIELDPSLSWTMQSPRLMEFAHESYFRERALEIIAHDPWLYAGMHARRVAAFLVDSGLSHTAGGLLPPPVWAPWLYYPFFFFGGRLIWIGLLAVIAVAFAWPKARQRMRPALPLLCLWLSYLLVHLVVAVANHDAPRMRMPIDAITLVLAGGSIIACRASRKKTGHAQADHQALDDVYAQVPPDYWDRYARSNPVQRHYYDSRFAAVRRALAGLPVGSRLLDVGCGSGYSIAHIVRPLPHITVTGVDVSPPLIDYARLKRPEHTWAVATGEQLPGEDGSFDVVTYLDVSEHLVDPIQSYREAYRLLRPGGRVVVQLVFEEHPLFQLIWQVWIRTRGKVWEHAHLRVYTPASLRAEIAAAGFSVTSVRLYHLGMWGVAVGEKPNTHPV